MDEQKPQPQSPQTSLPSVEELFRQSWKLFKERWLLFFLWSLVGWGISVGLFLVVAVVLGVGAFATFSSLPKGSDTVAMIASLFTSQNILVGGLLLIVLVLIGTVIGAIIQVGYILIAADTQKPHIGDLFKRGLALVIPLSIVNLFAGLLVWGGLMVFVIPGIIMAVLFGFSMYEVAIEGKRGGDALRRSIGIISANFWSIFGRVLLITVLGWVIVFLVQLPLGVTAGKNGGFVTTPISTISSILFGWYAIAYGVILYKQAKSVVSADKKGSLTWMVIVALAGWVLFYSGVYFGVQALSKVNWEDVFKQESNYSSPYKGYEKQMLEDFEDQNGDDIEDVQKQLEQYGIPTLPLSPTPAPRTKLTPRATL